MRSYAAEPLGDPLEAARARLDAVPLHRAEDRGAGGVVGAIIGELPSSIQDGLAGAILNFNQYYVTSPPSLWATNIVAALLGILFFAVVAIAERLARAPRAGERRMSDAGRASRSRALVEALRARQRARARRHRPRRRSRASSSR